MKLYDIVKTFRDIGLWVYSFCFLVIMFNARIDYETLVKFNVFGEGKIEYLITVVWLWSVFVVHVIDYGYVNKRRR